jgi:hypothetical protein
MNMKLNDRIAIVTGAAQRSGRRSAAWAPSNTSGNGRMRASKVGPLALETDDLRSSEPSTGALWIAAKGSSQQPGRGAFFIGLRPQRSDQTKC